MCQARNTISIQSRELAKIAYLNMYIRRLKHNLASNEASEESWNGEFAAATTKSIQLGQLFNNVRAEVADLREKVAAKNAVIRYIVEYSCVTLGQSLRDLVENFRESLKTSVSEAFRTGFFGSLFLEDAAIDGISLRFSGGATLEDGSDFTKGEDVVDPPAHHKVIEL